MLLTVMVMPITLNTARSNAVLALKCDVVPRADCMVIKATSITIATEMVQRTSARLTRSGSVSGMNHAVVHRKIVIETRNFIGLIHGLIPRMSRWSPIDSRVTTTSASVISAPVQNRSGSRARSSVTVSDTVIPPATSSSRF